MNFENFMKINVEYKFYTRRFQRESLAEFVFMIEKESSNPVGIYILKVNNRNTRTRYEICSKLTIKTFIVNFEYISHLALVFLFLTLNMQLPAGICL